MSNEFLQYRLPARIVGTFPVVVTKTGANYTISIDSADMLGGTCWVWQLKMALANANALHAVEAAVPAEPSTDLTRVSIIWASGARSSQGDTLSNFIKTTIGWSDAQMQALYAAAAILTY